jgi:plastocyanin
MKRQARKHDQQMPVAPSPLVRLTITCAIGTALALIYLMVFVTGQLVPPLAAFVVLGLGSSWLMARRIRWAPLLSAFFLLAVLGMNLIGHFSALAHPHEPSFAPALAIVAFGLAGVPAGTAAGLQQLRGASPAAPRWMGVAVAGLAGLLVGVLAVAAIPSSELPAVAGPGLASLPVVEVKDHKFTQDVYHAKAGQTAVLRLENQDNDTHTFTVDELGLNVMMPARASSLAVFTPTVPGTYKIYCVPHYSKATGQVMMAMLVVDN